MLTHARAALARSFARPRAPLFVIALAVALAVPSIALGFFADDDWFVATLEGRMPYRRAWLDLYRFTAPVGPALQAQIADGEVPWWAAPGLRLHLVRPLASALFACDHALFGRASLPYHLHSLVWYAALLLVVRAVYRRVLPGVTGTLALFVFAFHDANVNAYAWISARYLLVVATPSFLGLLAHVRYREDGWRPGFWLAPLGMTAALLGGEAALGGIAFFLAYELAGPPADREPLGARLLRAAPAVATVLAYVVAYKLVDGGVAGSGGYVEPMGAPLAYLRAAVVRFPVLLGNALLRAPAELSAVYPAQLAVVGAVLSALVALALRASWRELPRDERVAVRWLVPGALAAVLVSLGGFPGARLLVIANLGFAAVLAILVRHATRAAIPAMRRGLATVLALLHVVLAPGGSLFVLAALVSFGRAIDGIGRTAETGSASRVFMVAGSDPFATLYFGVHRRADPDSATRCASWLSAARASHRVTRTGERAFTIEPLGATLMRSPYELLFRAESIAMPEGYTQATCGARVRVVAVEGGFPKRIEVTSDAPLDSPEAAYLVWQGGALRRLPMPPVGESIYVAWSRGPSGFF